MDRIINAIMRYISQRYLIKANDMLTKVQIARKSGDHAREQLMYKKYLKYKRLQLFFFR